MGSKVCVTGGAGFIGSHLCDALMAAGHQVTILDDLSSGRKENVPAGVDLRVLDVRSEAAAAVLEKERFDVLFHLAAQMDVRRSVENPVFDAEVNLVGLLNLLEAARRAETRQVVLASTGGAIYGDQDRYPADEDHAAQPLSPYGVAKLASERYLYFYHRQYGLDATCLRFANVYGPRQNPHGEAGVVAIFLHRLLRGEQPVINGDGLQTRDYVWVGDVVEANLAALGRPGFATYNVGTGVETDVNTLFELIHRALALGPPAVHGPAKAGEQARSSIDSARLERELGVRVGTSLQEGIARTADWFRERADPSASGR
jgi:UDP-glucose 4-epimerase